MNVRVTELEVKEDAVAERLRRARADLAERREDVERERTAYRTALAAAEVDGAATPSRARLSGFEGALPIIEDRVAALEIALADTQRALRLAKADAKAEEADTLAAECTQQQARAHVLEIQFRALEREMNACHSFVASNLLAVEQLRAQAAALRR